MGQTILVLGALVLLGVAVLAANQLMLEKLTASYDTQATVVAISLAQAEIDEIQRKDYDEHTIARRIYYASDFTPVDSLGPEAGETSPDLYNDVDDYNEWKADNSGYRDSIVVSTPTLDNFVEKCRVEYVSETDPDSNSSTQTFYKRITVTVTQPSMAYPVVMKALVVYRRYF
ncbi:MAG: hypothetical protein KGJ59_10785 [Bacteroidota bacterium]|nr:hypothetical protein [Bacteroidota bacterium]